MGWSSDICLTMAGCLENGLYKLHWLCILNGVTVYVDVACTILMKGNLTQLHNLNIYLQRGSKTSSDADEWAIQDHGDAGSWSIKIGPTKEGRFVHDSNNRSFCLFSDASYFITELGGEACSKRFIYLLFSYVSVYSGMESDYCIARMIV